MCFVTPCVKTQGPSSAQFRCSVNSESCIRLPLLVYIRGPETFSKSKLKKQGVRKQPCLFLKFLFLSSRPPQTMRHFLYIWIAWRKCLCVSGNVVLWSKHFDIISLVPMTYVKHWSCKYLLKFRSRMVNRVTY